MQSVTKSLHFCAGHRLYQYNGACSNIHGHNYRVEITIAGEPDELGMVLDFKTIKATIGKWLDENWDHALLLNKDDPLIIDTKTFRTDGNPTAEYMARYLFDKFKLYKVKVWETEDSYAECC